MAEQSLLTDEVLACLGRRDPPSVQKVDAWALQRWQQAAFCASPVHTDKQAARRSRYHGLIAHPTYVTSLCKEHFVKNEPASKPPFKTTGGAHASDEFEFYLPVRPGDVITRNVSIVDIKERRGRHGYVAFVTYESIYTNQRGQTVLKELWTVAHF